MKQTDKPKMTEMRIYPSVWKNMLLAICSFALAAGGCMIVNDIYAVWSKKVIGGLGIILFGGGGLLLFLLPLYNRIRNTPLLIIYEDKLELYEQFKGTYRTIYFADVRRFRLIKIHSTQLIAIDYKAIPFIRRVEKSSHFIRVLMTLNFKKTRTIETLPASNLTMRGKEICEILNECLNKNVRENGLQ